jgi:hypothetical protein
MITFADIINFKLLVIMPGNKYLSFFFFFILPFSSCIDRYEAEGIESLSGILVVDGIITNDVTSIYLSRSVEMSADLDEAEEINDAILFVECSDGSRIPATRYAGDGRYEIETGTLNPSHQYRLHITLGGKAYASSFLSPLYTPEIDSISYVKRGRGEPVYITVSTHDTKEKPPYYRWICKEHWELKAELFANAGYYSLSSPYGPYISYQMQTSRNTYYCWGADSTRLYLTGSSEKLSANVIDNCRLIEIDPAGDKLSVLYYVSVTQYQIREEAYLYYTNQSKNMTQTSGIFSYIPAEMEGNIQCLDDPSLKVAGYVEVSVSTRAERFIPEPEGLYEPSVERCNQMLFDGNSYGNTFYIYLLKEDNTLDWDMGLITGTVILTAPRQCVDCTLRGTKNKPDFWPTEHL